MRKIIKKQMSLMSINNIDHPKTLEFKGINKILDDNPIIYEMVFQDLISDKPGPSGAIGMTAEQVVRAAVIKQMEGFAYEDLAYHIIDSCTYRNFCKIGFADKGFKKSALNKNIKAISPETWEAINRIIIAYSQSKNIEKGRKIRIDCTVVCSNIHDPSDSSLIFDSIRVITRILKQTNEQFQGLNLSFSDHTKVAKRRNLRIMNSNKTKHKPLYKNLIAYAEKVISYASTAMQILSDYPFENGYQISAALKIKNNLNDIINLTRKVIDQATRRVINEESVPANEKIVSIFEPHTDIIRKDRRDTYYGHKICLSGGPSNLITDCSILEGNPADTTLVETMLDRHNDVYGHYPLKVALDGGFASKANLESVKIRGVKDACFAKKKGLHIADMCRSTYVYKKLRNFRAGIESGISWLKRCFGLDTCTWKTFQSFKSYVWASIVSANLMTLTRKLTVQTT